MSLTMYFWLSGPGCFCAFYPPVLHAVAFITLSYNSLSSMASCLLPDSRQHHTGLFSKEKSTEISRFPLVTYQPLKRSLLTGVDYWLMSSCSMPVWSRSWVLLINWPWELKRTEIQGYPCSSHWPYIGGCAITYCMVLHSGILSIFQRFIKKFKKGLLSISVALFQALEYSCSLISSLNSVEFRWGLI